METTDKLGYASCAAVRQYLRTAKDLNLDVRPALTAAGIGERQLDKDSGRITGEQFQTLLRHLIEQSDDPLLGLKSGHYVQPGSYGALGYITMSCATLGEAIERIVPFEKLVGDMGVSTLRQEGDEFVIAWHCAYPDPLVRPHMIDNVLCSWLLYARWLADTEVSPTEIRLERPAPEPGIMPYYRETFQCPVRFGSTENAVVFPVTFLSYPLRQPDPQIRKTMEDHAVLQMAALRETESRLSTLVKNAILVKLKEGITRKDAIASQLGLNVRTLQRRLAQEHVTYQQLLDEVRLDLAKSYLSQGQLSFQEIAERLGFSETRSFHRSFKSWTGKTPGEFRASARP